jgi:orotidine-5'-phosphate decarboxylase
VTTASVTTAPVAVALDTSDLQTAAGWAAAAGPHLSTVKVGLQLFLRHGHQAVLECREASGGRDVFLDLKLHDIPNTVAGAARSVAELAPTYLTVHASGGRDMVRAAAEALPDTMVAGVTVLTSLSAEQLGAIGFAGSPMDTVRRLAVLAVSGGARALVCSPLEVAAVRREVGPDVRLITPGVRPSADVPSTSGATGSGPTGGGDDQARVATAEQALADGADLLVVGRPVTGAGDRSRVAAAARDLAALLA